MDRKEEIYKKALDLFTTIGYDQTPLSLIAKSLNISKAGLYHYFSSKEELLFAIHRHSIEKDFIPMLANAEKIEDPEERIVYFLKNYTIHTLTKDPAVKIAIHEINQLSPQKQKEITKVWRRSLNLLRNALSELESAGRIKKLNKTFTAFAALGMCSWTFYWFDYGRKESAEELADVYVEIFLSGIRPDR